MSEITALTVVYGKFLLLISLWQAAGHMCVSVF